MTALRQTLSSLRHRPGRAFLTALGTALGIGTIVALLAVSAGATQTAGQFEHLGRSDLGLFQKDAADPTTSVLSQSLIGSLRRQRWVADAMGLQLLIGDIPKDPGAIVFGANPDSFETGRMVFSAGNQLTAPTRSYSATSSRHSCTRAWAIRSPSRTEPCAWSASTTSASRSRIRARSSPW